MSVPKAVVFDLGKVLVNFDYSIAVSRLHTRCNISMRDMLRLIDQSPLLYRYETNLLSTEQFFAEIKHATGYSGDLSEFALIFGDIFSPIQPMIELHGDLRRKGVPAFVFSNTNHLAIGHIREHFSFFRDFDGYVLSCEHGAMKPDAKLYEVVERITGRHGPELLYIDDRPENIAAGSARGWQSILHETPEATRTSVRRTGLL